VQKLEAKYITKCN